MIARSLILPIALFCSSQLSATDYYFDNVNVIPMDAERVLFEQRVVVADGRITAMGPAKVIPGKVSPKNCNSVFSSRFLPPKNRVKVLA